MKLLILPALLAVWLNMSAFGFRYGLDNHADHLALVNWLVQPELYPDDIVPRAMALYPTIYWKFVAYASPWIGTFNLVFISFLLTKVIFFLGLARLVKHWVSNGWFAAWIISAIALSPLLNDETPFAYSDVLNSIQTQTSLAIALLIWVGCFLVEKRWRAAGIVLGCSIYLNVLFTIYTCFAFAWFALLDRRQYGREIILASVSMVLVGLPWLLLVQDHRSDAFPEQYVDILLRHTPIHLTLQSHTPYDILRGLGILTVTVVMIALTARQGGGRCRRLEWLASAFILPMGLGAVVGEILLWPSLLRLQFLRADSFLILYATVIIQVYGAQMLLSMPPTASSVAVLLWGSAALLFPIFCPPSPFDLLPVLSGLALLVFVAMGTGHIAHPGVVVLLTAGLVVVRWLGAEWVPARLVAFVGLVSGLSWAGQGCRLGMPRWFPTRSPFLNGIPINQRISETNVIEHSKLALGINGLVLIFVAIGSIPHASRLWNPVVAPDAFVAAWREVQRWAKEHTPQDTIFLVPPLPGGFRVYSERRSWVDWKDGNAMYSVPAYSTEWSRRMNLLGIDLTRNELNPRRMATQYREQTWEHLVGVASAHHITYIVQSASVNYAIPALYMNDKFAVYRVPR